MQYLYPDREDICLAARPGPQIRHRLFLYDRVSMVYGGAIMDIRSRTSHHRPP